MGEGSLLSDLGHFFRRNQPAIIQLLPASVAEELLGVLSWHGVVRDPSGMCATLRSPEAPNLWAHGADPWSQGSQNEECIQKKVSVAVGSNHEKAERKTREQSE